jgi:hypothetical protein
MIAPQEKHLDPVRLEAGSVEYKVVRKWEAEMESPFTNCLEGMAGTTGLEPAASAVTGQRSNQLNYVPTFGG